MDTVISPISIERAGQRKGIDTRIMTEAPIKLFVMGANVWRDEQEWPLEYARNIPYYLREDGRLSPDAPVAEAPDHYSYNPSELERCIRIVRPRRRDNYNTRLPS